jgi:hypothetical protein
VPGAVSPLAHARQPGDARLTHDRARQPGRQQLPRGMEGEDVRLAFEEVEHRGHGPLRAVQPLEPVVHDGGAHP